MTQADIPTWCLNFQLKLMAALDAAWVSIEDGADPAALREVRDRAKAIGDLAAMARKVALITPRDRPKPAVDMTDYVAAGLHAVQGIANVSAMVAESQEKAAVAASVAPQAEIARRALDKLKGGRRGRI
ncbi:hypothetical protein BH10PSE4_BH10PSE4_12410 [soil metagenome]